MKSILISIKPQWVKEILNCNKTIEIRKRFPKDYVGWVYIYCTKDKKYANLINRGGFLTGMVVARFLCDKVEEIKFNNKSNNYYIDRHTEENVYEITLGIASCLYHKELNDYLKEDNGYAIHITKLEIFDKPKELKEFFVYSHSVSGVGMDGKDKTFEVLKPLTKAPQSWCYIRDVL